MDRRNSPSCADNPRPGIGHGDGPPGVASRVGALRRRCWLAAAAGVTVVAGLAVHYASTGLVGDFVGDALYAVMVYLVLSFALVRMPGWRVAAIAMLCCAGIELFQLTGVPVALAGSFPPARLVLGTTFSAVDLVAYVLGVAAAAGVDFWRRAGRSPAGRTD